VDRRAKDGLRAGATAVGVAAGLMVLASTAQTPDGFVRASLGGPLAPFGIGNTTSDVLSIGDGAGDPSELAALLKGSAPNTGGVLPDSPYRAAYEAGAPPGETPPNTLLDTGPIDAPAPTVGSTPIPAPKSVVDSQGRVDCTGAVSCQTDPVTQVTTVTYPDGVVAIVQKVNDLTVVAYKTLTEYLPPSVQTLLPPVPTQAPPVVAAAPPPMASAPPAQPEAPAVLAQPTQDEPVVPAIDPGPPAPDLLDPSDDSSPGPRVNVTRPPMDFSPDTGPDDPGTPDGPNNNFPGLDKVKDALDSVVDKVGDAVGKAVGPGASGKVSDETRPAGPSGPSADDAGQP
jgi:hypothetical protein